ncbi:MAG TPA: proteasome accessory factor PafA2 family protein, partial [Chthoniobacterales bacterium]|nr:proteasome accessory factor PafA2 family protein [Chthoniobacterales bacterium]
QRSDFFSVLVSIDTMNRRPLVNTRDEPHADAAKYRRFHVIIGDANMSEWATALKLGTTALVLDLIESGTMPVLEFAQPIAALKGISRDQSHAWIVELRDGRKISAIDVQRLYLAAAQRRADVSDTETSWVLREWERVLDDLARDVEAARDRVDWVAKKSLLTSLQDAENIPWDDPWLQAIDLEYHSLDLDTGLYYELVRQGALRRFVSDQEVEAAVGAPPETTRAYFRGCSIARFGREVESVQWDEIVFASAGGARRVALPEPFADARLIQLNAAARESADFADFIRSLETL